MKLYVYDPDTMLVVAIAEGESNEECERKASAEYSPDDYRFTYSPAFGFVDGLIDDDDAAIL